MCGVSLLSILLVVASLLNSTTPVTIPSGLFILTALFFFKLTLVSITSPAPVGGIFNVSYTSDSLLVSLKVIF